MSSDAVTYLPDTLASAKDGTAFVANHEPISSKKEEEARDWGRTPSEITDETLLEQVNSGRCDALADLYQRHAQSIRNVARRILREGTEADDLLQEVFLYISRKAALFDPSRGSARSWIFHVAYHRAFDRRRYLTLRHFYDAPPLNESVTRVASDKNESMFDQVAARDLIEKIEAYLSPEQQQTIHLYFVEGHSLREIADKTGQTLGNVRNHYYRGLERLRSHVFKEKVRTK